MARTSCGIGVVGVVVVGFANVATTRAQSDEFPRRLRERISRTLVGESSPSAAAGAFDREVKIAASDGAQGDLFGNSVAISGDTAIVGALRDDDVCPTDNLCNSGSAYVYQQDEGGADNWGEVAKLTASDGAGGDLFGNSVAISDDTVIVGAVVDDYKGVDSGSAYVYRRDEGGVNNWGEVTKITASDGAAGDEFGFNVAISGDTAIVGAGLGDNLGKRLGWAYVFFPCTADAHCDDGLFCTGIESCVAGTCQSGTPPCDDGLSCITDLCTEATQQCDNVPDDGACDDGNTCNGTETCNAETGECLPGTPIDCDDGDECNGVESCNQQTGKDPRKNNLFIWHGCHSERSEESRGNCRGDPSLCSG